jgi:hypothetical protein
VFLKKKCTTIIYIPLVSFSRIPTERRVFEAAFEAIIAPGNKFDLEEANNILRV